MLNQQSPAELAATEALDRVYECIDRSQNFRLEAGAGAGKTYSLINALQRLIAIRGNELLRNHQQIACITFTNVAKQEIESRIAGHPAVRSDTVHGFCWSFLKNFQSNLRALLPNLDKWKTKIDELGPSHSRRVDYDLGYMKIDRDFVSIRHNDVLQLMALSLRSPKFRSLLTLRHPIIFVDEYQDTDTVFVQAIKDYFLGPSNKGPLFGFFGDHWQKIYGSGCGKIEHDKLKVIGKGANFRSVSVIVNCLNKMRPHLQQVVSDPNSPGEIHVFHTNDWAGDRLTGSHWKGDTPAKVSHAYLEHVRTRLTQQGWDFSPTTTKILMLTHSVLANEQGYPNILNVFEYNEQFLKKEDPYVAFFADVLEPMCAAYEGKRYGQMLALLPGKNPILSSHAAKLKWAKMMDGILSKRLEGNVGDIVDYIRITDLLPLPYAIMDRERELADWEPTADRDEPANIKRLRNLRAVQYREIMALDQFIDGHTPFATKHGVKGEEYENVLVVLGRGWNQYDFDQMLAWASQPSQIPEDKQETFERNRNLFYVACSRPKQRLALLFTQRLSTQALATLSSWFGPSAIVSLPVDPAAG